MGKFARAAIRTIGLALVDRSLLFSVILLKLRPLAIVRLEYSTRRLRMRTWSSRCCSTLVVNAPVDAINELCGMSKVLLLDDITQSLGVN